MIIVISHPSPIEGEFRILNQLFDAGLEYFQLYKPNFSAQEIEAYKEQIQKKHLQKVSIHTDHHKFHSLKEMEEISVNDDYAFLSPIFDSISKKGYTSKFDLEELKSFLKRSPKKIVALGGIDEDKIDWVKEAGFSGIALLGAIWQSENPVEKYKAIREKWED
ncbi:thiamine phosphate synthase [Marivirga lumbricoides]|uniref:Thiamine phosphate synthase n=1 Tax=Marivirga lumbricoides TaxID=1046115 RepID=A0ABQ1MVT0_9BACT|nr:thiamine phosphate synthase [Marivirga lumbricoides]